MEQAIIPLLQKLSFLSDKLELNYLVYYYILNLGPSFCGCNVPRHMQHFPLRLRTGSNNKNYNKNNENNNKSNNKSSHLLFLKIDLNIFSKALSKLKLDTNHANLWGKW